MATVESWVHCVTVCSIINFYSITHVIWLSCADFYGNVESTSISLMLSEALHQHYTLPSVPPAPPSFSMLHAEKREKSLVSNVTWVTHAVWRCEYYVWVIEPYFQALHLTWMEDDLSSECSKPCMINWNWWTNLNWQLLTNSLSWRHANFCHVMLDPRLPLFSRACWKDQGACMETRLLLTWEELTHW